MSIKKILARKDADPTEQLSEIAEIVAGAREAYGNKGAKIESPMCNTTNGQMEFSNLEPEAKVELLRGVTNRIKAEALETARQNSGVNVHKEVEKLVATDPHLTNIAPGTKFEYL